MATVSDESSNNKINIVTNVENNVTVTQPNIQTVTVKAQGPQGPAGPAGAQGPAGDGDLSGLNAFTGSAQASINALNIFTGSGTFTTISASLVTATTGSFTHLKGNSPITIQDSVTFQQPVTGSIFSGSFVGDGTNITGVTATLPNGILSGSDQIASNISGSFTAPSSSFSTRITSLESGGVSITPGTVSSSLQITQLGFVTSSATSSFITSLPNGLLSGSSQIATEISGAFASPFTSAGISGSFNISSASFSTRITSLEDGGGSGFTSAGISGSLGVNATLIRSLTAVNISGSFTAPSSSFSTRVTTLENNPSVTPGTLSGSAQIATEISGAFGATSSSLASRTTTLEANPVFSASSISGSSNALSASFSTRVTTNTTNITSLTAATSSYLTSLPVGVLSGSAQIASNISGSFTSTSSSLASRTSTLEGNPVFSPVGISGSLGANATLIRSLTSVGISGSFIAPSSSFSSRVTANETNITSLTAVTSSYLTSLPTGVLSGSAQIASSISGSFGSTSSSLATRITANAADIVTNNGLTFTNLSKINSLTSVTGSYATTGSIKAETLSIFRQEGSPAPGTGATQSIAVTVADVNGDNKYLLGGVVTGSVVMNQGDAYKFDQSDGTNDGHPFRFSTDAGGSSNYSTGVTTAGVPGQAGAYTLISVTATTTAPLYYYCTAHANMGLGGVLSIDSGSLISTGFVNITGSLTVSGSSTFIGDQSTTGHITASGNISASGQGIFHGGVLVTDANYDAAGTAKYRVDGYSVLQNSGTTLKIAGNNYWETITYGNEDTDKHSFTGQITASGTISGSAFIGDGSGLTNLPSSFTSAGISGSFVAPSASFSTRVTSNETNITSLTAVTSSYVVTGSDPLFNTVQAVQLTATTRVNTDAFRVVVDDEFTFIGGGINVGGDVTSSAGILATGTVLGSNLSGTNTGDQDLSSYALITAVSGAFTAPSSSFSTRVTTLENAGGGGTPTFIASGSTSASADPGTGVVIEHSGSTAFSVIGDVGTLFSVDDDLTGTLFSVNDISGIPQLEVSASGKVEVGKGPLIANTFETGSINEGATAPFYAKPSSPLQMTMPSASSAQLFGVAGYYRVSWDDSNADFIFWEDDNIKLSYDVSGVDIEGEIKKDPSSGEIHIAINKDGTRTALDKQVSDGGFDLNSTISNDDTDTYTFIAPKDPTWPFYRINVTKTSATHDGYFYAIIEKFI